MRLLGPEAETAPISSPFSRASFRAKGEANTRPEGSSGVAGTWGGVVVGGSGDPAAATTGAGALGAAAGAAATPATT